MAGETSAELPEALWKESLKQTTKSKGVAQMLGTQNKFSMMKKRYIGDGFSVPSCLPYNWKKKLTGLIQWFTRIHGDRNL
ncbi:unnamed protein product [Lactuca virosa]|uniref:Uncharacterized protein n=1 Tax=Lactuca virosa TaxID=75947 RepID=A0AAU9LL52_9ASTR|nr:unnamed protein product [Lactuca virosa]